MPPPCLESSALAPLQRLMLASQGRGDHVEQVEISFSHHLPTSRIQQAWRETVEQTEALQISFSDNLSCKSVQILTPLVHQNVLPASWATWLAQDRQEKLLIPNLAPWRAVFWPDARRFVWTFHHALLDGRSVTRVLRNFLDRIGGNPAPFLPLSKWIPPSAEAIAMAEKGLLAIFRGYEIPKRVRPPSSQDASPANCSLGRDFLKRLSMQDITVATQVTWAWGQALLAHTKADTVLVEQLRAGAPQPDTAGFTMNTMPILMRRADKQTLLDFRNELLALREIESVSPADFPPNSFPNTNHHQCSMIMVEHGTLQHQLGHHDLVSSVTMHEPKGHTSIATAYLMPDMRLEVEGPDRHELLNSWVHVLEEIAQISMETSLTEQA